MIYFKKGSIVPRRIGILLAQHKKAQHYLVFGVDMQFDGKTLTHVQPLGPKDHLIKVKTLMAAPRKNGTQQRCGFIMCSGWAGSITVDPVTGQRATKIYRK